MTREGELAKQPSALPMFQKIADYRSDESERVNVLACLWLMWNFEHALDDLLDESQLAAEAKEDIAHQLYDLIENILTGGSEPDFFLSSYDKLILACGWEQDRRLLAAKASQDFIGDLLVNPFIRAAACQFLAMYQMMVARMLDGDEMAASSIPFRQACAPAVRCGDVDFIVHVAKLAGGWAAMREIGRLRDYDPADAVSS